ncbi:30S ribosomal protein S13 [Candidatus Saccharibacteria bacterium]|nr:30S ribosomal protein S13 [Candidatus Saccharibacteria bacterium]
MARIADVTLPNDKQVETALTYVYGIGRPSSQKILAAAKVKPATRVKDLKEAEIQAIAKEIGDNYLVEGKLQRLVFNNIKRLQDIRSYRGLRHTARLPARGQRTKTNARTRRGKKVTVGGTAKKALSKT